MLQAAPETLTEPLAAPEGDVLVVAALPEELAPLVRQASGVPLGRLGSVRAFRGALSGIPLLMASTGVGPRNAERGVRALLEAFPARLLLGIGTSGGLSPGLEARTILVGRSVWDASRKMPGPDPFWLETALASVRAIGGALVSVPRLVPTREQKAALYAGLPSPEPAVVDMESSAWVKVASEKRVPYVILRSVFDGTDQDLPEFLVRCQDKDGGLGRGRVIREALIRPHLLPHLLSMGRRVRHCAGDLARCVSSLLESEASVRKGRKGRSE